jgi:hypothetical protein
MLAHDNSFDQPQNRSPASFRISNPDNEFVDNVAADSVGVGYWFALHMAATGLSNTNEWRTVVGLRNLSPPPANLLNLGKFEGNVAHSIKMGIDVHDSVQVGTTRLELQLPCTNPLPQQPAPCSGSSGNDSLDILTNVMWQPPLATEMTDFTAYGCVTGIYTGGGVLFAPKLTFRSCVLADNGVHMQFASADTLADSLLVYDSGNDIWQGVLPGCGPLHTFERGNAYVTYDGPANMRDCYLVGFSGSNKGNLVYSDFGAARRHTGHTMQGLVFAGGAAPAITFTDFTSPQLDPALDSPRVWGFTIRNVDGSLSLPGPSWLPGSSLVTNHPMVHLADATRSTLDVSIGTNAWLSPFTWAHLQVRYYSYNATPAPTWTLLQGNLVPPVVFTRLAWHPYPGPTVLPFQSVTVNASGFGSQMRQLPVIVRPPQSTAAECVYEVVIRDSTPAQTLRRVDLSVDDGAPGIVTRLVVKHSSLTNWNPEVRLNDDQSVIHENGSANIASLPLVPLGSPATCAATCHSISTVNGVTILELRLVNVHRTHRVTITWP